MENVTFLNPEFFWLFITLPLAILWYFFMNKKEKPTLKISTTKGFKGSVSILPKLQPMLFVLRLYCFW